MSLPMSILWPGFEEPSDVPLVKVTWSYPLSQANLEAGEFARLDAVLQRELDKAFADALATEYLDGINIGWQTDVRQIGSNAENFHAAFGWLTDFGWAVLLNIAANRGEAVITRIASRMREHLSRVRERAGAHNVSTVIALPAAILVHICVERMADTTNDAVLSTDWKVETSRRESSHLIVTVRTLSSEHHYTITSDGRILDDEDVSDALIHSEKNTDDFEWPSQDGVDRSESVAVIGILSADLRDAIYDQEYLQRAGSLAEEVRTRLQQETANALETVLEGVRADAIRARHYQVGPAAGGLIGIEHYIISLYQSRDALPAVFENLAEAWGVYEIASQVYQGMKAWISRENDEKLDVAVSYPARVLELSCKEWIQRWRHPKAVLESDWICLTKEFYGGYVSPGHPTESVQYLVIIRSKKHIYEFKIWGTGDVDEAVDVHDGVRTHLPVSNIFLDEGPDDPD